MLNASGKCQTRKYSFFWDCPVVGLHKFHIMSK